VLLNKEANLYDLQGVRLEKSWNSWYKLDGWKSKGFMYYWIMKQMGPFHVHPLKFVN